MHHTLTILIHSAVGLAPAFLLLLALVPIFMVTWAKAVPWQTRLPWALVTISPLLGLYAYLTWLVPSITPLQAAKWLNIAIAALAYIAATTIGMQFRRRHLPRRQNNGA